MADIQYRIEPSREYPHVAWIDLHNDGILHECAIMRRDRVGNILYFKTNDLDEIDKRRLANILYDRNARSFELWDLMSQRTLGNGCNALAYFHQLVKQLTPNGKILDPKSGQMGGGSINVGISQSQAAAAAQVATAAANVQPVK